MITKTEVNKDNVPVRTYHRAGTLDGRVDEKYIWTHDIKKPCVGCTDGLIPPEIRGSGGDRTRRPRTRTRRSK